MEFIRTTVTIRADRWAWLKRHPSINVSGLLGETIDSKMAFEGVPEDKNVMDLDELNDECLKGNFGFGKERIKYIRESADRQRSQY